MKFMIDIPEDVYTRLFDNGIQDNEIAVDDVCEMARALRLGTPLPKNHGKLKDEDEVIKCIKNRIEEYKKNDPIFLRMGRDLDFLKLIADIRVTVPEIIRADKESDAE